MRRLLTDYRVFWKEFRQNFHTTGAVLPSGRLLARSLARFASASNSGKRILEVGPGTGAITARLVRVIGADDQLDLVELNAAFVARLRQRFEGEPAFRRVATRSRVLHQRLEELPGENSYDVIVSGLPLNNFAAADVESILKVLIRLLRPGGTLSFFEYIAIRQARALVSNAQERERLRGIGAALAPLLRHEIRRDWIWPNFPPAWVHHVRFAEHAGANGAAGLRSAE